MARTIMVANDVYEELKARKGEMSFSELFVSLLRREKKKTGKDLLISYGVLEGDKEFALMKRERENKWKSWTRKYA